MNVLLVEPAYRTKFPPLGLLRLASYHRSRGDGVTFVRGLDVSAASREWHRVYVSSLFTWELPLTARTAQYYADCVPTPADVVVGGIGATLNPAYLRARLNCTVLTGLLDQGGELEPGSPPLSAVLPDYSILGSNGYAYDPSDAYFVKTTTGCIRRCSFCAVPVLEGKLSSGQSVTSQIARVDEAHGPKQHLVVMDNNVLGLDGFTDIIQEIASCGFHAGAVRNKRLRRVDFNQGLDCRLVTPAIASALSKICISPVRLALDSERVSAAYTRAIERLSDVGLHRFTNYLLFNFDDAPSDLYRRMRLNIDLSVRLGIAISGFPMRYIPLTDSRRGHVGPNWRWRYLRGMQCVLLVTRGVVSARADFFDRAFGRSEHEFVEILAMPDRYIIWRDAYENNGASEWRRQYQRLSADEREQLLALVQTLHITRSRRAPSGTDPRLEGLIEHYYPRGAVAPNGPPPGWSQTARSAR